jgi:hypothetical protein
MDCSLARILHDTNDTTQVGESKPGAHARLTVGIVPFLTGRVLQLIFERNPINVGCNQNGCAFLWSRDIFSEGQFTAIFGVDYQLVQIEFCYCFEHQLYLGLSAATIREFEFCSQNLFTCF